MQKRTENTEKTRRKVTFQRTTRPARSKERTLRQESYPPGVLLSVPAPNQPQNKGITVQQCAELWLLRQKTKVRASSYDKYYNNIQKYILPYWADIPCHSVTDAAVQQFIATLTGEKGLATGTVRDLLSVFYRVLNEAGAETAGVSRIYPEVERKESRVLTPEEHHRLLGILLQHRDSGSLAVLISLSTGLRIGEVCGLRWEDISPDFKTLTVKQSVERVRNYDESGKKHTKIVAGPPKSKNSRRTVPVTAQLAARLQDYGRDESEIYILSGKTTPPDPRRIQRALAAVLAECGLQGVHFHTLRHSFATRCVECEVDVKTISAMLGHSDISVTMNTYVHPSDALKRSAVNKLASCGFC